MGRNVLLVDDEPIFREPIAEILREGGYFVEEVDKGQDAINRFKKKNFDLLITDMAMPGMNGVQLIKNIHSLSPATEAIVISAYGTESTKDKLNRLGVYGYLDKPVLRDHLLTLVDKARESNRLIRLGYEKKEVDIQFTRERILIADDDPVICDLLKDILTENRYKVMTVSNGNDAVESILVNDYEMVILDINMPKMNGIEAVKEIREQDPYVYIILISGEAESEEIKEALSCGADIFIQKPFKPEKLLKTVEKVDFAKIKKKKAEQVKKEEKEILKNYTLYHRLISLFTLHKFRERIVEAIILIAAGILIGAFAAFVDFDFTHKEDPLLDRNDKLIDAVRKNWGR